VKIINTDVECTWKLELLVWQKKKKKMSLYKSRRRLGGAEIQLLLIFDLGTRWGWVISVTSRPLFRPGKGPAGTRCTGGWVGPRVGLDTEVRGIIPPLPGIEPRSPGHSARSYTLYWLSYRARILCDQAYKYSDVAKFWSYVETNTEPLCVKLYSFVHYHIFVHTFKLLNYIRKAGGVVISRISCYVIGLWYLKRQGVTGNCRCQVYVCRGVSFSINFLRFQTLAFSASCYSVRCLN
jgi:hypothetical protein